MNKEEFYKMINDEILEYMPEDFKEHTVRIDEVNKSGDVRLHGLCLIKGDNGAAPVLYLEPYFDMYREGKDKKELLGVIADQYYDIVRNAPNIVAPDLSFENIKDNLRVRLVYNRTNYNTNNNIFGYYCCYNSQNSHNCSCYNAQLLWLHVF